jgi:hypothetical protein
MHVHPNMLKLSHEIFAFKRFQQHSFIQKMFDSRLKVSLILSFKGVGMNIVFLKHFFDSLFS